MLVLNLTLRLRILVLKLNLYLSYSHTLAYDRTMYCGIACENSEKNYLYAQLVSV